MERMRRYAEVRARHVELSEKLQDCLHLVYLGTLPTNDSASARSKLNPDRRKRIDAMMRRQSFATLDDASRRKHLKHLTAPLVQLHGMVQRYVSTWNRLDAEQRDRWEQEHIALFSEKFRSLYASQD
jgi:hypothetical protein